MRTTIAIDDHLLAEAKVLAARQHRTLSDVIQDALRVSIVRAAEPDEEVVLPTYGDRSLQPLVDINDKEAMAELLGDNEWPRRDDADR